MRSEKLITHLHVHNGQRHASVTCAIAYLYVCPVVVSSLWYAASICFGPSVRRPTQLLVHMRHATFTRRSSVNEVLILLTNCDCTSFGRVYGGRIEQ